MIVVQDLKFSSRTDFTFPLVHTSISRNNALNYLTAIKMTVAHFVATGFIIVILTVIEIKLSSIKAVTRLFFKQF
jgi:hypothetical protein